MDVIAPFSWRVFYDDGRVMTREFCTYELLEREKIKKVELISEDAIIMGANCPENKTLIIRRRNKLESTSNWTEPQFWYIIGFLERIEEDGTQRGEFWIVDDSGRVSLTTKLKEGEDVAYPVQLVPSEERDLQRHS